MNRPDISTGTALEVAGISLLAVAFSTVHILLGLMVVGVLVVIVADEISGAV